jgi:hypothetical protein
MFAQRAATALTQVLGLGKGESPKMTLSDVLRKAGVRSTYFYVSSLASIALCISLWIRAKTVDQDERGNAERRALFVGLWPPMFWLIGDSVKATE